MTVRNDCKCFDPSIDSVSNLKLKRATDDCHMSTSTNPWDCFSYKIKYMWLFEILLLNCSLRHESFIKGDKNIFYTIYMCVPLIHNEKEENSKVITCPKGIRHMKGRGY